MKRYIIIVSAILGIMTMTACQAPSTIGGESDIVEDKNINITTASAKVSVQAGCVVSEWDESTGGAVRLREWLNGFETEPAESVPEDGRRCYAIELTFGRNAPECYEYLDCGEECYLRSGDEWFSVGNPSPLPVGYVGDMVSGVWGIVKVEYAHCAEITELDLSDKEKMALSEWLCGLKYERREFPEGETPGDSEGGEVYTFTFENGELSYVNNGGSECYLLFDGEWYSVPDPSEFPVEA